MSIESFITEYGYLAVFLGVFVEGEAFVITAGFLAATGLLQIEGVLGAAFAGSVAVYNLCFLAGRLGGERVLTRFPGLRRRAAGVRLLLKRYNSLFILGYRLMFGLRAMTPFALGMSGVGHARFFLLDLAPAAAWAAFFSLAGYGVGEGLEVLFGGMGGLSIALAAVVILALAGTVLFLIRRFFRPLPQPPGRA